MLIAAHLGMADATGPSPRSLEIQAYDALCFPGLAAEWADGDDWRPFVGALTLELPTEADEEVLSWIAEGTPPIYFGFGSGVWLQHPAHTLALISVACARLGERALICAGASDFTNAPHPDHVKVVERDEPCGHFSGLPRGGSSRWRRHDGRRHAGRNTHVDPLAPDQRSADLGRCRHAAESRFRARLLG